MRCGGAALAMEAETTSRYAAPVLALIGAILRSFFLQIFYLIQPARDRHKRRFRPARSVPTAATAVTASQPIERPGFARGATFGPSTR